MNIHDIHPRVGFFASDSSMFYYNSVNSLDVWTRPLRHVTHVGPLLEKIVIFISNTYSVFSARLCLW